MSEHRTYKIFIVDDDNKHLAIMEETLREEFDFNLDIHTFTSGQECLDNMSEKPDIIVLDYYFSHDNESNAENGLDVLKKIKEINSDTPVVMMSHQDKLEVAINCYDYGAKDYIIKNETAYLRAQIIIKNIISGIHAEEMNQLIKEGARRSSLIMGGFIVMLLAVILIVVFRPF